MAEPIRILEIVNVMDRAGLETMLMNYYRHFNRDQVQLDFLTHRSVSGAYDEEIEQLGGRIYRAPRLYPQNWLKYKRYMKKFFEEHHYPVVHSHIDAMSAFPLAMARKSGVAVRVAHSHNDSVDRDLKYPIKQFARWRLPSIATHYWACSENAGAFLFGESNRLNVTVVKNAIDLASFKASPSARNNARDSLGIAPDQLCIGHVGRFCEVKNQALLVSLVKELVKKGTDVVLLLIGDGPLRSEIEIMANDEGVSEHVCFLGLRDDVNVLMQAFDILVFPSLHEGIPLTLIEAQATGVPVLTSDRVASEALILSNSLAMPLEADIALWADKVKELADLGRVENAIRALCKAGYEINSSAQDLMEKYISLYEEARRNESCRNRS